MRIERINDMERYIIENGSVTSDKLCEVFRISKNTLLRDLNILSEKGTIKKVYGGVTAMHPPFSVKELLPFNDRDTKNIDLKQDCRTGCHPHSARGYHFCGHRYFDLKYPELYYQHTGTDDYHKQRPVHVPCAEFPQYQCDCPSRRTEPQHRIACGRTLHQQFEHLQYQQGFYGLYRCLPAERGDERNLRRIRG